MLHCGITWAHNPVVDLLDETKLRTQGVEPALTLLKNETIPAIEQALERQIANAGQTLAGLMNGLAGWSVQSILTKPKE